jgi:hypothetical protein
MSLALDNILKFLIATLVALIAFMGKDMLQSVNTLSDRISKVEVAIAEMKVEIKHLAPRGPKIDG